MPNYRRNRVPGGTYFFTVVTAGRRPLFDSEREVDALRRAAREVRLRRPFEILAWVVLPDHLHSVWRLPDADADYPLRWAQIKRATAAALGVRGAWQRGYWEHTIRDAADLERHVDYVHWNPVKHGLVGAARDWPWSSFHRAVSRGEYPADWGAGARAFGDGKYGE